MQFKFNLFKPTVWQSTISLFIAITLCMADAAKAFELKSFKRELDQSNLALVLDWLAQDLRRHNVLNPLEQRLKEQQPQLLQSVPHQLEPWSYEDLIIQGLKPEPAQRQELRRQTRNSVEYLNLSQDPQIWALKTITPAAVPIQSHDFQWEPGFPAELTLPTADTPHTLVNLQHYNRRRLGAVAIAYAIKENWPLYLFDCPAQQALAYLQSQGYEAFYQLNAFYTRWGKEVYLARQGQNYTLVYTDIYGDWMYDHLLYMLHSTRHEGQDLRHIRRYHFRGKTSKDLYLEQYRKDLRAWYQPQSVLVLGYLHLFGQIWQARYQQQQQAALLRQALSPHELAYQSRYSATPDALQTTLQAWIHTLTPQQQAEATPALIDTLMKNCQRCPLQARLSSLPPGPITQRGKGQALLYERIQLQDTQGQNWQFLNLGANHSLYGDMSSELLRIALEEGYRDFVFAGSAGAVNTRFPPYSLVVPAEIRDLKDQKVKLENSLSPLQKQFASSQASLSFGTVHQGVRSPVAETEARVRQLLLQGVDTLDIEVAEMAKVLSTHPEARFSVVLLVTDYPGAFLKQQSLHLDQIDFSRKYQHLPLILDLLSTTYHFEKVSTP